MRIIHTKVPPDTASDWLYWLVVNEYPAVYTVDKIVSDGPVAPFRGVVSSWSERDVDVCAAAEERFLAVYLRVSVWRKSSNPTRGTFIPSTRLAVRVAGRCFQRDFVSRCHTPILAPLKARGPIGDLISDRLSCWCRLIESESN